MAILMVLVESKSEADELLKQNRLPPATFFRQPGETGAGKLWFLADFMVFAGMAGGLGINHSYRLDPESAPPYHHLMNPPACIPQRPAYKIRLIPAQTWRRTWLCAVSLLLLGACSGSGPKDSVSSPPSSGSSSAEIGPAIAPLPNLPAGTTKPGDTVAAAPESVAPIPTPMETFRALMPEQGLNVTPLFATPVRSDEERFKRLETSVQGLRNDFDTIMPTMVRMASMENDMRTLVDRLKTMTGDTGASPSAPPPEAAPVKNEGLMDTKPAVSPEKTQEGTTVPTGSVDWEAIDSLDLASESKPSPSSESSTPSPQNAAGTISGLRVGDHGATTRIVLDLSERLEIKADLQRNGMKITIPLSGYGWGGKISARLHDGLVSGYDYANGTLSIDLTRASVIKSAKILPPSGGSGYRYVIDAAAAP